jgi:lipopolysaccharide/colanic/teichoic acid biosynthesis glycosyltransferase
MSTESETVGLVYSRVGGSGLWLVAKRMLDVVTAVVALLLLAPVMLMVALAVRVTSPGPVFFRQSRVGRNGVEFRMVKFRTMCDGAHRNQDEMWQLAAQQGMSNKLRDDPRVTPVGRLLRTTSIDELPQLVNVLLGHMSLVGPRPLQPVELSDVPDPATRHSVRPGLTGLWQVSGRSDTSWAERMTMDVQYVQNWSLRWDVRLLLLTLPVVLFRRGSY